MFSAANRACPTETGGHGTRQLAVDAPLQNPRSEIGDRPQGRAGAFVNGQGRSDQERAGWQFFELSQAFHDQNAVGQPVFAMARSVAGNAFDERNLASDRVGPDGADPALGKEHRYFFVHSRLIALIEPGRTPVAAMPAETNERHIPRAG